jgi:hypothetical protein
MLSKWAKIISEWAIWKYRLWNFQGRDTKLERVLAKNQLLLNEFIEF